MNCVDNSYMTQCHSTFPSHISITLSTSLGRIIPLVQAWTSTRVVKLSCMCCYIPCAHFSFKCCAMQRCQQNKEIDNFCEQRIVCQ